MGQNGKHPKVSVCIPVHNAELWLAESIESIIAQTFSDWEIVVFDDCSTDSTRDIIEYYSKELGDRFSGLFAEEHFGIGKSRNACNRKARGEIICVQDADDLSQKDRLRVTWAYMKRHKDIDLIYGAYQYLDPIGKPYGQESAQPFDFEKLKKHNYIAHPTVAYKRQSVIAIPYRETCKVLDDWFLYYDFAKHGMKISCVGDVLAFYRILPDSVSRSKLKETEKMRKEFLDEAAGITNI